MKKPESNYMCSECGVVPIEHKFGWCPDCLEYKPAKLKTKKGIDSITSKDQFKGIRFMLLIITIQLGCITWILVTK